MNRTRVVQSVSTLAERKSVILWMIEEVEACGTDKEISSKAVTKFKKIFNQPNRRTNRSKARDWWNKREQILHDLEHLHNGRTSITSRLSFGTAVQRTSIKARKGRGVKRHPWKVALHQFLFQEFVRLRELGVKVTRDVLKTAALRIVDNPEVPVTALEIEVVTGKSIVESISTYFIADFCNLYRLVSRQKTGNLTLDPAATKQLHREVSYHLGCMKRAFEEGLDESDVENYDETNIQMDMVSKSVLDFVGTKRVRYGELSNGRQSFTVCMRISGGPNGKIETPFVIFQNNLSSYPILGVPDNIDGVKYRSNPKGYMNQQLFTHYFGNPRVITALPNNRTRQIWIDKCTIHNENPALVHACELIKTILNRFTSNATTLIQPLDQYLLRIFKEEWKKKWEQKRAELIPIGAYTSTGRITNPGKHFYLQLVKDVVDDLNQRVSPRGLSLARESLIHTGLAPDADGIWKISQLTSELQAIVQENIEHFNGLNPVQE